MNRLFIGFLALLLCVVWLQNGNAFSRSEDHVISKGKVFKEIRNTPINKIRVYAVKKGKLKPIPFQIDKVNLENRYILDMEDEKERIEERKEAYEDAIDNDEISKKRLAELKRRAEWVEDMNIFDAQDELVFMAWDLGGKASANMFPKSAAKIEEIAITNPVDSDIAYAYALLFESNPPALSPVKYIKYDQKKDRVETTDYITDFDDEQALIIMEAHFKDAQGNISKNYFDRFKMRIKMDIKYFFTMNFDENNTNAKIIAIKLGPVRLIKRMLFWMDIMYIQVTPTAIFDYVFYPNGLIGPSELNAPIELSSVLNENSYLKVCLDFNDYMIGSKFYTEKTSEPVCFDGQMSEAEKVLDLKNQNWFVVYSEKGGGFFCQMLFEKKLIDMGLTSDLVYIDDKNVEMKPEQTPGQLIAGFGASVVQFPKGKHNMYIYMYMDHKSSWKRGKEKRYLNFISNPLETRTKRIK